MKVRVTIPDGPDVEFEDATASVTPRKVLAVVAGAEFRQTLYPAGTWLECLIVAGGEAVATPDVRERVPAGTRELDSPGE